MAVKICFVFLLTILVVQKSELSPVTETYGNVFAGIIDEALRLAQETINYIAELIKETVELASQTVDDALKTILEKGKDVQSEAQDALRKLLQSVAEEIKKAKDKALEAGADISECISGQEDAAKEAIEEVTQEIAACVSDKVSEGTQVTQELLSSIRNATQFAEEVAGNIIACFNLSGPFKVLDCVIAETSKATKQTITIVTSIKNKVIEVKNFVILAVRDLSLCAGAKLLKAQERVAEILKNITVCVDGKLNPNNSDYERLPLLKQSN
ncbi:uncharacterized protein LOC111864119 [Cryptotermes secundus]|nr:uncharacterized protein LOC111864119 [Cryptotermes secundus]